MQFVVVPRERESEKRQFKDASKKPGIIALSPLSGIDQNLARLGEGIRGSMSALRPPECNGELARRLRTLPLVR